MTRPLSLLVEERLGVFLNPSQQLFLDQCGELQEEETSDCRSGRSATSASLEEPDWWQFYVERAARRDLRDLSDSFRPWLGLAEPLSREAAAGFVREVIAEAGNPKTGYVADLRVPSAEDYDSVAIYGGWPDKGDAPLVEWQVFLLRGAAPARFRALVMLARMAETEGSLWATAYATWSAAEIVAFVLCDIVPTRPWMRYSFKLSKELCPEITLTIPTAAVTPEHVRALYEDARQALLASGPQRLPKAISKDRMRLVRFVEADSGSGPYDWNRLLDQWRKADGSYGTPAAMKAAFYQSANPVRVAPQPATDTTTPAGSARTEQEG